MNEPLPPASPVVAKLNQTQPWLRFIAILMLIATGLMIVSSLVMIPVGMLQAVRPGSAAAPSGATMAGLGFMYLVLSALYLFPALFLLRGARRIRELPADAGELAVAEALEPQRRFWKFVGIMAIVMLSLYLLLFIGLILVVAVKAASHAAV